MRRNFKARLISYHERSVDACATKLLKGQVRYEQRSQTYIS